MSENKSESFGLVTWDVELGNTNNKPVRRSQDDFIRLQPGSNVVRIVTKPYQYWSHKYKENENDPGFGDKVMCSSYHGSCPLCDQKVRRSRRWFIGVIDRKTQSYKVLDMSRSICQDVQKLSRDEEWGDPGNYDIDIVVDRDAGPQGYYTVIPKPPKPLSQEDVETKQGIDLGELERKCTPPTPEQVQSRLDFIAKRNAARRDGKGAKNTNNKEAKTSQPTMSPAPTAGEEDSGQYDFPVVN